MSHFTYSKQKDKHLCQGDILKKTDDLIRILENVYPYFLNAEYEYFMVLTQSCDLIRRNGQQCKSKYITLCAVRTFDSYLQREIEAKQRQKAEKGSICDSKNKKHFHDLLERLFNNNEQEYFFLAHDYDAEFPKDCVAYLKVSIALKASEHYDDCFAAKLLEIDSTFQAKIGWLVGHMYSRVGTPDWVPEHLTDQAFKEKISNTLDENITWLESEVISELSRLQGIDNLREEEIEERAKSMTPKKNRKEKLLDQIDLILCDETYRVETATRKKIIQRIRNDQIISSILPSK